MTDRLTAESGMIEEEVVRWLRRECDRLDRQLGIRIAGGTVKAQRVPGIDVGVVSGVDFEAERDGEAILLRCEGNVWGRLRVVAFEGRKA